jgi:hypothetical protein
MRSSASALCSGSLLHRFLPTHPSTGRKQLFILTCANSAAKFQGFLRNASARNSRQRNGSVAVKEVYYVVAEVLRTAGCHHISPEQNIVDVYSAFTEIRQAFRQDARIDAEQVVRAVFRVLAERVTAGEVADVKHMLPAAVRELWPA